MRLARTLSARAEDSARRETEKLLPAARQVVSSVDKLYDGPMPASTSWM